MRITHSYQRTDDYLEGEYVVDTAVGTDTGTTNFATGRMSRLAPNDRYVMENISIIDLHDETRKDDIDTIGDNLRRLFAQSNMQWFWDPPSPVTSERQVDQLTKFNNWSKKKEGDQNGKDEEEKRPSKPPIMYAVYGMTHQIVAAHADPALVLDDLVWDTLMENGIDPASLKREGIVWVPRSGSQKSYLDGIHGKDRKKATLTAAPRCARDNGDEATALFLESLPKQKPAEDACDIVLQLHHFLEERRKKEVKETAKEARASAAEAKREEKETKRKEREEKAAQRKEAALLKAQEKEEKQRERERKREEKEALKKLKLEEKEKRKAEREAKAAERQLKKSANANSNRKRKRVEHEDEEEGELNEGAGGAHTSAIGGSDEDTTDLMVLNTANSKKVESADRSTKRQKTDSPPIAFESKSKKSAPVVIDIDIDDLLSSLDTA